MTNDITTSRINVAYASKYFSSAALFLILIVSSANAQTYTSYSPTSGSTPSGLAPGSPAGSYALSGFDNINLFNQSLNFNLPLHQIGGRGSAGYTMMLPIERKFRFIKTVYDPNPPCPRGGCEQYFVTYTLNATSDWWHPEIEDFGPGMMLARFSGYNLISGCFQGTQNYQIGLTRLTFVGADGTEYEFRDKATGGKPLPVPNCSYGAPRGPEWVTADGSSATFISDVIINDAVVPPFEDAYYPMSGYMLLRDGTRYRIDQGKVSWIRDRNGNLVRFTSDHKIIDSLNREVEVSTAYTYPGIIVSKEIKFTGFNGAQRTIRILYDHLSNALRPANGQHPAETIKTFGELFPEITDWGENNNAGSEFYTRVISSVELPDGRSYRFFYNSYGELARVELPTGGAFEYDWSGYAYQMGGNWETGPDYDVFRYVEKRRVYKDGNSLESEMEIGECTNTTVPAGTSCRQVDQRDASNNLLERTRHFYSGVPITHPLEQIHYSHWREGKEYKTESLAADGVTVLRRVETDWAQRPGQFWWHTYQLGPEPSNDTRTTSITTTMTDSNQVSLKTFAYDDTLPFNNQSDVKEYDFGQNTHGPLLRHTHTDYLADSNYVGLSTLALYLGTAAHLRSLPSQQWVSSDDNGTNKLSLTTFEYDNYASDSTHNGLTERLDISGLCTTFSGIGQNNVCSNTNPVAYTMRGNPTSVTSYTNAANQSGPVTVAMQYDVAGNIVKFLDAKSISSQQYYATIINYEDCYGAPDNNARINSAPNELATQSKQGYAFVTSVTNPLGHTSYSQYSYYLGAAVNGEDINGVVASGFYNDLLDRPTKVVLAENIPTLRQQKSIAYDDSITNRKITVTSDLNSFNDNKLKSETLYDGLGRTFETHSYESDGSVITSKQFYDALGRVIKTTNPYRTTSEPTYGETITTYDVLGRVTKAKTTPANAEVLTAYSGNTVTVTDQAGKQRKSVTDALGRLTAVYEAPNTSGYNFETRYQYTALDNLVKVTQGPQDTTNDQVRTFVYDGLSRLTSASNPESGTISYSYDSNGNLITKTDARATTTTQSYDLLNRVTQRSYGGGSAFTTPAVTYTYDSSGTNSIGRLTSVSSSVSANNYTSYDALGRITGGQQVTGGQTYSMSYQYDLAGNMTSQTYPTGRVVTQNFDNVGRLASISGQAAGGTPKTYANAFVYTAHGAIERMRLGNGRFEHTLFNSRLQPIEIGLGLNATSSNLLKLEYNFGTATNNGNVLSQKITVPGINQLTQTYTYDQLNRLLVAAETGGGSNWQQTFLYDRFGNRNFIAEGTNVPYPLNTTNNPTVNPANNRLQGHGYDNAGNMTQDAQSHTYAYDGENHLVQYDGGPQSGGASYSYDGNGRRVRKIVGALETIFVYNTAGQLVAEYTINGVPGNDGTSYLTSDTLGTPRVISRADGSVKTRHDYLPFGEEIGSEFGGRSNHPEYATVDNIRQKFTSKERDYETGLDYFGARYYANTQGRFTSIDPIMLTLVRLYDPSRLNLYSYCRNNPLNYLDPDGRDVILANAAAQARARTNIDVALKENERKNIDIRGNKVVLINKDPVTLEGASPAYVGLWNAITGPATHRYFALGLGDTATATYGGEVFGYETVLRAAGQTVIYDNGDTDSFVPISNDMTVADLNGDPLAFPEWRCWWHEVIGHGLGGSNSDSAVTFENAVAKSLQPPAPERNLRSHQPWDGKTPLTVDATGNQGALPVEHADIYTGPVPMRPLQPLLKPN